jgi:hypothetical protein
VRKHRKIEINLEVEEAIAIRTPRVLSADCRWCLRRERMIAANEAAVLARLSVRELFRLVEAGRLHFTEDACGLLYVCAASLQDLLNRDGK